MPTKSDDHMHKLADITAAIILLSLVAFTAIILTGLFGATVNTINATWFALYSLIVVMSSTKLYGKKVYKAVKDSNLSIVKSENRNT